MLVNFLPQQAVSNLEKRKHFGGVPGISKLLLDKIVMTDDVDLVEKWRPELLCNLR